MVSSLVMENKIDKSVMIGLNLPKRSTEAFGVIQVSV